MEVIAYKLKDLWEMENKDYRTIKNSPKYSKNYIPVQFENALAKQHKRMWTQKNAYSVRYIRLKDIKQYIEKKTWKKLVLIDKDE